MIKRNIRGPQFVQFFQPVVDALVKLGGSGQPSEVKELIADELDISEAEQSAQITSGASRFSKNVDWARFYLEPIRKLDMRAHSPENEGTSEVNES